MTLVENMTSTLRGFSGRDEIFINTDHFREKIDGFKGDLQLLQILAKIDIISVVLHEFAHVKIRKVNDGIIGIIIISCTFLLSVPGMSI